MNLKPSGEFLELVPERPDMIPLQDFQKYKFWRPYQREAIALALQYFLEDDIPYVVLNAPTGFGKSLFAMATSVIFLGLEKGEEGFECTQLHAENCKAYVVTETKQLQDQYLEDFPELIKTIKGRSNYPCPLLSDPKLGIYMTASECIERAGQKCPLKGNCPYFQARDEAVRSPVTIHNYSYFLNALNYTRVWPEADLLIFDEAHLAENKLADFVEFRITSSQLRLLGVDRLPKIRTPEELMGFLYELDRKIASQIVETKEKMLTANKNELKDLSELLDKLERFQRKVNFIMAEYDEQGWLMEVLENTLTLRPIWVHRWGRMLYRHGDYALFMSATISPKNIELLGIEPEDIAYIEVPAIFPVERRPIVIPEGSPWMNKRNFEKTKYKALKILDKILDVHFKLGHKGLIHTSSHEQAEFIMQNSRHKDRLLLASGKTRNSAIEAFKASKEPVALVSPSLHVGADFKHDLARFQVIFKVPYPSLGDRRTYIRKEQDPDWFQMVTGQKLVQAYGRTNRAEDDFSVTYIIDANAVRFKNNPYVPGWFKEAIVDMPTAIKWLSAFLKEQEQKKS